MTSTLMIMLKDLLTIVFALFALAAFNALIVMVK